jgi:hypothetical protein
MFINNMSQIPSIHQMSLHSGFFFEEPQSVGFVWWTHLDSNQGPLACEASALTGLSYASTGVSDYRAARAASQVDRNCSAGR